MRKKPWNKGRIIGQKTALTHEQVRAIRTVLASGTVRDSALFALAIDSSLREGDLLNLRVGDVQCSDATLKPVVTVLPSKTRKTGLTISFEPTDHTKDQLKRLIESQTLYPKTSA